MNESGRGAPPCPYAFAVLGSAGRGREPAGSRSGQRADLRGRRARRRGGSLVRNLRSLRRRYPARGRRPYCKGGVMAKNPPWRGSAVTWRETHRTLIRGSRPQDLLSIDIFFDMAGVHGDPGLSNATWRHAFDAAKARPPLQSCWWKRRARGARPQLFGRIRTEKGRIDLREPGCSGS